MNTWSSSLLSSFYGALRRGFQKHSAIYDFFEMNTVILSVVFLQRLVVFYNATTPLQVASNALVYFMKNYLLLFLIEFGTRDREYIHEAEVKRSPISMTSPRSIFYVASASVLEAVTYCVGARYIFNFSKVDFSPTLVDCMTFIPLSLASEIVFDFFHYWAHRLSRSNKYLYNLHKEHHKHKYPTAITTFYQHPIDLIISNSIPALLSAYMVRLSPFQISVLSVYKTFVEIGGHSGKVLYPTCSFPQINALPKLLGIELYSEDHDIHHSLVTCNYAKRFSIWDKIFGTFVPRNTGNDGNVEITLESTIERLEKEGKLTREKINEENVLALK